MNLYGSYVKQMFVYSGYREGDLAEVSKRVKENISGTWKVRAVSNTPRPGSLMSQADVSS